MIDELPDTCRIPLNDSECLDLVVVHAYPRDDPPAFQTTRASVESHQVYGLAADARGERAVCATAVLKAHRSGTLPNRLEREIEVLGRLVGTPGVPHLRWHGWIEPDPDAGSIAKDQRRLCILTDIIPEIRPLESLLHERASMRVRAVSRIAALVRAVHARGVTHGNLTPSNVRWRSVDAGGIEIWLFGFGRTGIVGGVDDDRDRSGYSARWLPVGEERSRATDVFATACCAYELLRGKPLFGTGADAQKRIQGERFLEPHQFSDLPGTYEQWTAALSASSADRTNDLLERLESYLSSDAAEPTSTSTSSVSFMAEPVRRVDAAKTPTPAVFQRLRLRVAASNCRIGIGEHLGLPRPSDLVLIAQSGRWRLESSGSFAFEDVAESFSRSLSDIGPDELTRVLNVADREWRLTVSCQGQDGVVALIEAGAIGGLCHDNWIEVGPEGVAKVVGPDWAQTQPDPGDSPDNKRMKLTTP